MFAVWPHLALTIANIIQRAYGKSSERIGVTELVGSFDSAMEGAVPRAKITVTFECDPDQYFRFKAACKANAVRVADAIEFLIRETNKNNRVTDIRVTPEQIAGPGPMANGVR